MADQQVGNISGVTVVGNDNLTEFTPLLATTTAHGTSTVTVPAAALERIRVGSVIDLVHVANGTVLAAARTITSLTSAGVLTYDGANVTSSNVHGVYLAGTYGQATQYGYFDDDLANITKLRARLKVIDSTLYSDANLDTLSYNDLVYAVRLSDAPATIK